MLAVDSVSRRARHVAALVTAAAVAAALFSASNAAAEGTIRGPGGPSKFYSGNCTESGATDPVGVVFEGEHSGPSNVSEFISAKTGWDTPKPESM